MGKIYGQNLWAKFMGKIYGQNLWEPVPRYIFLWF
jgi:hypothetical protein